jgi:hypothetical protein
MPHDALLRRRRLNLAMTDLTEPRGGRVRARFMDTPFLRAAFQVIIGGVLVLIAGILIGGS